MTTADATQRRFHVLVWGSQGGGETVSPPQWRPAPRPRPDDPRPLGAVAVAPTLQAWGYEPTAPSGRPSRLAPDGAAGQAVPGIAAVAVTAWGYEPTSPDQERAARAPVGFGADAIVAFQGGAGFEPSPPSWRRPPPILALGAEAPTPSAIGGAGIDTSPALWRPTPRFLRFLAGEPSPPSVVTAAGFNVSAALARLPPVRAHHAGEPTRPVLVVAALTAWGYEPIAPGGRVSRPVRAGLEGDPLPRVILATLAGFDPTPAVRRPQPGPIGASGDVALPGAIASWGWEPATPGARVLRSSMSINGEAVPGATATVWFDTPAAAARALRPVVLGPSGEPLPLLPTIILPAGVEPSPVLFRVTRAVVQIGSEVFAALIQLPPLPVVKVDLSESPAGARTKTTIIRSVATSMTALRSRTRQSDG